MCTLWILFIYIYINIQLNFEYLTLQRLIYLFLNYFYIDLAYRSTSRKYIKHEHTIRDALMNSSTSITNTWCSWTESCLQKVASSPASHVGAKNHVSHKGCSKEKITRIPLINLTNFKTEEPHTIISQIEAAEKLYGCVIDFQI